MNAKHEPAEVRRQQFFHAALQVCAEKGYEKTRMSDIAARAGLSKGSLYHHFESKEQLFLGVIEALSAQTEAMLEHDRKELGSARAALIRTFDYFMEHFAQELDLIKGLGEFVLLGMRNEEFRARFAQRYVVSIEKTAELLQWGKELGEFDASLDAQQAARILIASGDGLAFLYHSIGWSEELLVDARMQWLALLAGFAPKKDTTVRRRR